jgi:apolipoprotein N-acyltransferase
VVSGVVVYLAFPPVGAWPLAPLGVAGAALVVRGVSLRRSYGLGVLFGLAFMLPMLRFTSYVGLDAWIILSLAEAAILAVLAPATTLVTRLRGWPVWLAFLWVGQEALRGRAPFGGFPWAKLAFSQPGSPFTPLAAVGGSPLVTFAVALCGGLVAAAALAGHRATQAPRASRTIRAPRATLAGPTARATPAGPTARATPAGGGARGWAPPAALLAAALAAGAVGLAVPLPTGAQAGSVNVAAIQGNATNDGGLAALGRARQVTEHHLDGTLALAAKVAAGTVAKPDLVLWPENSSDQDPFVDPEAAQMLSEASQAIGRPILVGAVLDGPGTGHVRNAGLIWGPNGWLGQMYVKQHPVPFAEYLPGRSVLQKIVHRFAVDMPNDFVKGKAPGALTVNGVRIGDVICFEVAYDGLVRSAVDNGAQLLVVQTNNASFGRKGESQQQLAMTRMRAVEFGRATVQVSTSGQSALIMPDGHVVASSGLYQAAQLSARLPLRTSRTLADRLGVWPEATMVVLGLLALLGGLGSLRSAGPSGAGRGAGGQRGPGDDDRVRGTTPPAPGGGNTGGGGRGGDDRERGRVDGDRIVVCIPTYNERENLREIVTRLRGAVDAADVLVIDDASPDGTGELAEELAAEDAQIQVLHRSGKEGLGAAYVAGFSWALEQGYDVVVEMDADGSHQPEELPRLLDALAGADLVIGSRWVRGGEVRNWPVSRKVISLGGNAYVRVALGMPVADATAGFRAYRAAVLRNRPIGDVTSQGYCFQVDLAWHAWRDGFTVTEVPITFVERQRGQSKMSRSIVAEALWRVTWWSVRSLRGGPNQVHPDSTVGDAEPSVEPGAPAAAADGSARPDPAGDQPDRVSA